MTATDAGLMPLVLQLGRVAAATMDVAAVLGGVCATVPKALGIGGTVLLLEGPPAGVRALTASDERAAWLGELQQSAGMGPLPGALRTGRPMVTADLTRIGPPALAAAAAECGLVSSLALPIEHDGERLGALQVLGGTWRPVDAADGEALRPLVEVLAARLVDVRALAAASPPPPPMPSPRRPEEAVEVTTRSLPVVTPRPDPLPSASPSTTPRLFVPGLAPAPPAS